MVELSTTLGLAIFSSAITASIVLWWIDRVERIDLSTPYGQTIPWSVAVIGAGIFAFADQGVIGIMSTLATGIFIGAIVRYSSKLREE